MVRANGPRPEDRFVIELSRPVIENFVQRMDRSFILAEFGQVELAADGVAVQAEMDRAATAILAHDGVADEPSDVIAFRVLMACDPDVIEGWEWAVYAVTKRRAEKAKRAGIPFGARLPEHEPPD